MSKSLLSLKYLLLQVKILLIDTYKDTRENSESVRIQRYILEGSP